LHAISLPRFELRFSRPERGRGYLLLEILYCGGLSHEVLLGFRGEIAFLEPFLFKGLYHDFLSFFGNHDSFAESHVVHDINQRDCPVLVFQALQRDVPAVFTASQTASAWMYFQAGSETLEKIHPQDNGNIGWGFQHIDNHPQPQDMEHNAPARALGISVTKLKNHLGFTQQHFKTGFACFGSCNLVQELQRFFRSDTTGCTRIENSQTCRLFHTERVCLTNYQRFLLAPCRSFDQKTL
jgi:hypothetical protein